MEGIELGSHAVLITIAVAVAAGAMLMVVARRLQTSAIVVLLLGGIVLGPEMLGVVQPSSLGDLLPVVVSLAVGLILFEGGLTLEVSGYRSASALIRRLLSVGVLVTWFVTAALAWLLFGFPVPIALLAGSLVIVTGPTVIAPLLKRIHVTARVHQILHWEGVLIDPIGVFIAILCFEFVDGLGGELALVNLALRVVTGLAMGALGGYLLARVLELEWVPDDLQNVFALGGAILVFGLTEAVGHRLGFAEAGLLSVVAAGFVIGARRPAGLADVKRFKADITELMIGMLFVLLAARLQFADFARLGWRGAALVAALILVVRPLNVVLSSAGLGVKWREKVFLGWVAPRGIVAASMASLFAIDLKSRVGYEFAGVFVETFTYSVIIATVLLAGFTAGPLARLLGLVRTRPIGWMIVGAHELGRQIARFLIARAKVPVVLVDTNPRRIARALDDGLVAIREDARDLAIDERPELIEAGRLLALTDNEDLNSLLCERWRERFGKGHLYRWGTTGTRDSSPAVAGRQVWPGLAKPSALSAELAHGEARVVQSLGPHAAPGEVVTSLVALIEGRVVVDPPPDSEALASAETLSLRREVDILRRALHRELVLRLDVSTPRELYLKVSERLAAVVPDLEAARAVEELLAGDRFFPAALGHGVAAPHVYCPELAVRLCAVVQLPRGVDFRAYDGERVHLAFVLFGPPDDPEGHLEALAEIARLVSRPELRQQLAEADVPDGVLELLRTADVG